MINEIFHRNSQKRFYDKDYIYFITTITERRYPFFQEELFCELFIDNLRICKKLKGFLLYGFIIIFDHIHLLLKPNGKYNISQIMQSLKQNLSCDINRIILPSEGETPASRLQEIYGKKGIDIISYKNKFHKKYDQSQFDFPDFKWQQSFRDHIIRNEEDYYKHKNYIASNCAKHNICKDIKKYEWSYLNSKFQDLLDYY